MNFVLSQPPADSIFTGHTVAEIEAALADILGIEEGAEAYIDDKLVDKEAKLQAGQRLEFRNDTPA